MVVVGAGIAGLACARALTDAGVGVRVLDRGRRVGGRLGGRRIRGRVVDLGASYLVAGEGPGFADVVHDWVDRGLARPWTDTFAVVGGDRAGDATTGPMRYAAPGGLRSLAEDLASGLRIASERTVGEIARGRVDGDAAAAVVLAMPAPQAARLLPPARRGDEPWHGAWEPVLAVVLEWERREWPADLHGAFVHGDPDIAFLADDGDRRGDGAPVLVVHTTPERARQHLDDPDGATASVLAATRRALGIRTDPVAATVHRWSFARPAVAAGAPYFLDEGIAACGDAWGDKPSVRTAWTSGDALGRALAGRLGG